jgi:hypothetical protein
MATPSEKLAESLELLHGRSQSTRVQGHSSRTGRTQHAPVEIKESAAGR